MEKRMMAAAIGAWILLGASGVAWAGEETLRLWDIRSLTGPVEDWPGPRFSLTGGRATRAEEPLDWEFGAGGEDESAFVDEERLLSTIRESDPSVDWDAEGAFLKVQYGRLFARQGPAGHRAVERCLQALETEARRTVCVRAVILDPRALPDGEGGILTREEGLARIGKASREGMLLETLQVVALNGQRAHAVKGSQCLRLAEFDIEVASGITIHDPVMAVVDLGTVLDARARIAPSGASFSVTVRITVAAPAGREPVREVETPAGRFQAPAIRVLTVEATVTVPADGYAVLGSTHAAGKETEGGIGGGGVRILLEARTLPAAPK